MPLASNRQLNEEGERMLANLRTKGLEEKKKAQEVTAGDKQKQLLEQLGAPDLIDELQVLAVPDA